VSQLTLLGLFASLVFGLTACSDGGSTGGGDAGGSGSGGNAGASAVGGASGTSGGAGTAGAIVGMCSPGEVGEASVFPCVAYDPIANGMTDTGDADVVVIGFPTTLDANVPVAISLELGELAPSAVLEFYVKGIPACESAYGLIDSMPATSGLHCIEESIAFAQNGVLVAIRNGGSASSKIKSATVCPNGSCN
jgi:hypothetical protein